MAYKLLREKKLNPPPLRKPRRSGHPEGQNRLKRWATQVFSQLRYWKGRDFEFTSADRASPGIDPVHRAQKPHPCKRRKDAAPTSQNHPSVGLCSLKQSSRTSKRDAPGHLKEFVTVLLGRRDEFRARGAHWGASAADSEG